MRPIIESTICSFVPLSLQDDARQSILRIYEHLDDQQKNIFYSHIENSPKLCQQFIRAVVGSEYIAESCCCEPSLLLHWLLTDAPFSKLTPIKIIDAIETACSDDLSCEQFDRLLRRLRRRFMTALYWRDMNQLAEFDEVSAAMTIMAETFVQQALDFHYKSLEKKNGTPVGKDSKEPQPMLVIGMGKLGGSELNVSSDIDLIFIFPEGGETQNLKNVGKIKSVNNQQFFTQLGQKLIKSLNEITADGFVFRVDMRLRPYGQSGSLVSNFSALENYYESQGRAWERFAAVKARVIACANLSDAAQSIDVERKSKEVLYAILKPFIYRKYVDFAMVESLRKLKSMIAQEVKRKGMQNDIKLGSGGIREIEFIAQSFQLIRGGRDTRLQEKNLLLVLDVISSCGYLKADIIILLKKAYLFLRKTEHMIQAFQDKQTQRLPLEDKQMECLAWLVSDKTSSDFLLSLEQHRFVVSQEFQKIIADSRMMLRLSWLV